MAKVTVDVALPKVLPVPVIVIVALDEEVGVPEITPVVLSRLRPAGRVPEVTAKVILPTNPLCVRELLALMGVPVGPVIVCVDGDRRTQEMYMSRKDPRELLPIPAASKV